MKPGAERYFEPTGTASPSALSAEKCFHFMSLFSTKPAVNENKQLRRASAIDDAQRMICATSMYESAAFLKANKKYIIFLIIGICDVERFEC